jgi:hypothetical protein
MRKLFLLPLCLLGGCATHTQATKALPAAPLGHAVARANLPSTVTFVETQYEIAGYRDPADSAVWHEPHAILRRTQVPGRAEPSVAETGPLTAYLPASYAPLPPSAELAAVLEEQRQIASEMRAMKAKMFALQGQAQAQYGKLVAVTTDTDRLRQQLAGEEARLKQRETESDAAPNTPQAHW